MKSRTLKIHVSSFHLHINKHKCGMRDHAINFKENLNKHVQAIHLNLKHYKCQLCKPTWNKNHKVITFWMKSCRLWNKNIFKRKIISIGFSITVNYNFYMFIYDINKYLNFKCLLYGKWLLLAYQSEL